MNETFLQTLFADAICDERRLAIFTLPNKRTRHFSSLKAAALYAADAARQSDVYFGVGLAGANFGHRNNSADIVTLGALWADIDMVAPYRAGKPLLKTLDDVRALLAKLPFPPTLLIHSGSGVHAYWLLKEPWILDTAEQRTAAVQVTKGWHALVCRHAQAFGWTLENLGDPARVLRLPGTFNRKATPAAEVRVLEEHLNRRYNPSDFEPFAETAATPADPQGALVLRPDAEPPADKFATLMATLPAFAQAWEKNRPELKDQSQSAYDLSLANIAALNGWTDQEIANLLIAARRKHNQNTEKALRRDYMARTIAEARRMANERTDEGVDISALLPATAKAPSEPALPDPGPMPEELLRVPGFISELMDHSLQTAPYPNQVMSFCGALALQAFLAGRKVCDPGDNRTNLYLLGLAHSAAGKDWPRKINTRIAHSIGLAGCLGDRFASGEGIQDALFTKPCMLFQTDEIDGMLQSINKAKDARHENIMGTLLTMYSSANSVFPMRAKAGKESAGVIDQPCLVVFGTAIPNHYYDALSERMLTNGFFARMIILEHARRGEGQEPVKLELPSRLLSAARWWSDFRPGNGNLEQWHPIPTVVEHMDAAKPILIDARKQAEHEYAKAEERGDPVGTTVWGRVNEHVRKLSLLHAISVNHISPRIDAAAARWASQFVMQQTRRMLFMAESHVSDNGFHARCKKVLGLLRDWRTIKGSEWMPYWRITRKLPWTEREHDEVRASLIAQHSIEYSCAPTPGRPARSYRLA